MSFRNWYFITGFVINPLVVVGEVDCGRPAHPFASLEAVLCRLLLEHYLKINTIIFSVKKYHKNIFSIVFFLLYESKPLSYNMLLNQHLLLLYLTLIICSWVRYFPSHQFTQEPWPLAKGLGFDPIKLTA